MFEKVIIAVDSRGSAHDAIQLARKLVSRHGSLLLAHVDVSCPLHAIGITTVLTADPVLAAGQQRADRVLCDVSDSSRIGPMLRITATSVGRGLHELVEREGADLLVMGSTRHGLIGRVLAGDDTRESIDGAPCAVAIAPGAYAGTPGLIREVGVAYNKTPEAEHALTVGRALAATHHAKLSVFEAVSLPLTAYYAYGIAYADVAATALAGVARDLAEIPGVVSHAAFGDPAEELTIYSASVDLLVVGAREFSPLSRLVHSRTSIQLTRSARCPLLILARMARAAERPHSSAPADPLSTHARVSTP